jgi:hypothetical protein
MPALRDKAFTKGMEYGGSGMSDTVRESFEALQRVALDLEDRYGCRMYSLSFAVFGSCLSSRNKSAFFFHLDILGLTLIPPDNLPPILLVLAREQISLVVACRSIWMNIRDCLVLAREDPATLVRTLEVIEMEDRAPVKVFAHNLFIPDGESAESVAARDEDEPSSQQKQPQKKLQPSKAASARRAAAAAAKSSSGAAAENADEENGDDDESAEHRRKSATKPRHKPSMRERCFAQLEKSIAEQFALKFKDRTESDHRNRDGDDDENNDNDKPQPLPEMLKTAKTLIDDLEEVSEFVAQCFPPAYEIFDFYVQRYQKWLYTRFVARIGDPAEVAPGDILFTINWIQTYQVCCISSVLLSSAP